MLLKIIGCMLVVVSTSYLGFLFSKKYADRPLQLKMLQGMLHMFETEVYYLSSPIGEAFVKITRLNSGPAANIFRSAAEYIESDEGLSAFEAWERAVRDNVGRTAFTEEDGDILISFGKSLGNSDMEGQLKNIRFFIAQLKLQEEKAEENRRKNEKLYKHLGVLAGLAIVIILM